MSKSSIMPEATTGSICFWGWFLKFTCLHNVVIDSSGRQGLVASLRGIYDLYVLLVEIPNINTVDDDSL